MRTIWHALHRNDFGTIVKLLMLTGQRAGEIAGLRWSEVDFERALILLPGQRTKNGRPHEIPLAETALGLLKSQPRRGEREFVLVNVVVRSPAGRKRESSTRALGPYPIG